MDLEELLSLLDSSTVEQVSFADLDGFRNTYMLSSANKSAQLRADAACFMHASVFNSIPESSLPLTACFIYLDVPLKPFSKCIAAYVFHDRAEWSDAFELFSAEFAELQRRKESLLDVTPMVAASTPVDKLLDVFEGIVGAGCSVLDNSLSIIAISKRHGEDAGYATNENLGVLSDDAIEWMKGLGLVNPEKITDIGIFSYTNPANVTSIFFNHMMPIYSHGVRVATISFFSKGKQLRRSRVSLIPLISQILALRFQQDQSYLLNKPTYYTRLFKEIESGEFTDDLQTAAKRFSAFGYKLLPCIHIAIVDLALEELSPLEVANLASTLHPAFSNSVYTVKESEIIYMCTSTSATTMDFVDMPQLKSALAGSNTKVGISNLFMDLKRANMAIDEAHRSIKIGKRLYPHRHVYTFHRLRIDDMLCNVKDPLLLYSYRYPPLMELIRQDKENGTNLAYTLYAFLQNPENPKQVAEELFIHKNTLYYRLHKIRQVIGHEFRDAETTAILQITFHVLRVQGRFQDLVLKDNATDDLEGRLAE